jgi:hypothetical protein
MGIVALAVTVFVFGPLADTRAQPGASAQPPLKRLVGLNLKFDGSQTCGGNNCHGKAGDDAPPTESGHELTIWDKQDLHKGAYALLEEAGSKEIGDKMTPKIADVKTSQRCLECHALDVPANLRGQKFNLKEGNTCVQCHGPSQKWLEPHAEKDWVNKQRAAAGSHAKLLETTGIYDTKPLVARAEICVGCHLQIGADLVAAGHPQPWFELDYFTDMEPKHWRAADEEGYPTVKIWMVGQVVALEEAMKQLADRAAKDKDSDGTKLARQQAMAHLAVFKPAAQAIGVDVSGMSVNADSLAADAANVAKLAAAARAKIEAVKPDKAMTVKLLGALSGLTGVSREYGPFGMQQQASALRALYRAYAAAENVPDAQKDAVLTIVDPRPEKEPTPDEWDKTVAGLKGKLPS